MDELVGKLDKLEKLNNEEQTHYIFKWFSSLDTEKEMDFLRRILNEQNINYLKPYLCALLMHRYNIRSNVIELSSLEEQYKSILTKTKELAHELKLDAALELCNLYTYLLWNGYFSKNHELKFQVQQRNLILGHFPFDIMNGIGVCLNFSEMLTDFINQFDYSSATVVNNVDTNFKRNYMPSIDRKQTKMDIKNFLLSNLFKPLSKRTGNHAFNLINENGNLYIYDATNLSSFVIKDKFNCSILCGEGHAKMYPLFSYVISRTEKSKASLDVLNEAVDFKDFLSRKEFICTWEENMEKFNANKVLLNDFYAAIHEFVAYIADNIPTEEQGKRLKKFKKYSFINILN